MSTATEARHAAPPSALLNGVEKVAVLLLALGKGRASKLLKHFDPDELRLLTRSAADLRTIGSSDLETLVEEFAQRFSSGVNFVGTAAEIKNLLAGVMTDEEYAEATGQELPPPPPESVESDGSVWEQVSKAKIETLQAFLMKEHPQTAALVLSRIDSDTAAKAMGSFPAAHRSNLLCRLLDIKKVAPDALRVVELVLKEELLAISSSASHTGVADILNRMDKTQSEAVLRSLRESRPDDAKAIKEPAVHVRGAGRPARRRAQRDLRPGADRASGAGAEGHRPGLPGSHSLLDRRALAAHGGGGAAGGVRRLLRATSATRGAPSSTWFSR